MDLAFSPAEQVFAQEVRAFFARDYPRNILDKVQQGTFLSREDHVRSQQALRARGWLGGGWPAGHGGPDWTAIQAYIFGAELERAGAPDLIPMALVYIGPIIAAFGSEDQKQRWLPDILESRTLWAQGYSELEAGSDLAALSVAARREGDEYVVDGTKIWTTGAHWADWIFCLARTERTERRQDGISMICVPLDSPGVRVEPIITMDGSHELNRVVFDNVRTSVDNRIGEEGRGWHYANVLLAGERLSYAHIGRKNADLAAVARLAAQLPDGQGGSVADDPCFAAELAAVRARTLAVEMTVLRALTGGAPPSTVSAIKVLCTELAQQISALWLKLAQRQALRMPCRTASGRDDSCDPRWRFAAPRTGDYLFQRAQSIYGGTTEVQKTIIWRELVRSRVQKGS